MSRDLKNTYVNSGPGVESSVVAHCERDAERKRGEMWLGPPDMRMQ